MAAPSPRHRFQFRLRTLIIGVTLLAVPCGYVSWQVKIVRDRHSWIEAHQSWYYTPQRPRGARVSWSFGPYTTLVRGDSSNAPSRLRRWLGDDAFKTIAIVYDPAPSELAEMKSVFPEADIQLDKVD